jgi:hypothetical protein
LKTITDNDVVITDNDVVITDNDVVITDNDVVITDNDVCITDNGKFAIFGVFCWSGVSPGYNDVKGFAF